MRHSILGFVLSSGLALAVAVGSQPTAAAAVTLTDTTVVDFDAGTPGACYVAETTNGEVLLPPTVGAEFSGATLPPGWVTHPWTGGTATVAGGKITVSGAVSYDSTPYAPGRSLEFVATFDIASTSPLQAYSLQTIGLGATAPPFDGLPLIAVATLDQSVAPSQGFLNALVWETAQGFENLHLIDGQPHTYRIDWSATSASFWVDGTLVHTLPHTIGASMQPAISSFDNFPLVVDWMRMTPYGSSCTFESRVLDGGNAGADWTTLTATSALPAGTAFTFETRSGNTPTPDGSWSSFAAVAGTTVISPTARYLQYRAGLSSSDPDQTPELRQIEIAYDACTPGAEVCDGLDNDCNGQIDDGLGSTTCGQGVCNHMQANCVGGVPQTCDPFAGASPEICDGLDDDCNGAVDDGLGSTTCGVGACENTAANCVGGTPQTCTPGPPGAEVCNGIDDDCNGAVDDGLGSTTCGVGACENTAANCVGGTPQTCTPGAPGAEVCNGIDDDCNGAVDDGLGSTTCGVGACENTVANCSAGTPQTCTPGTPSAEVCNGIDDDCNGAVDDGLGSTTCGVGACENTVANCSGGTPQTCVPGAPGAELCSSGLDENCDGQTDEAGCLCDAPNIVTSSSQTKITKVKLSDKPDRDRVFTKGIFTLPVAGAINPATQTVHIRVTDSQGPVYEGVIPAGGFIASASGRTFTFSDPSLAHDGIKKAKFVIKGDGVTVKYRVKAQKLNQPPFTAGVGTATIIIGPRCFEDGADACTLSPAGSTVKCQ